MGGWFTRPHADDLIDGGSTNRVRRWSRPTRQLVRQHYCIVQSTRHLVATSVGCLWYKHLAAAIQKLLERIVVRSDVIALPKTYRVDIREYVFMFSPTCCLPRQLFINCYNTLLAVLKPGGKLDTSIIVNRSGCSYTSIETSSWPKYWLKSSLSTTTWCGLNNIHVKLLLGAQQNVGSECQIIKSWVGAAPDEKTGKPPWATVLRWDLQGDCSRDWRRRLERPACREVVRWNYQLVGGGWSESQSRWQVSDSRPKSGTGNRERATAYTDSFTDGKELVPYRLPLRLPTHVLGVFSLQCNGITIRAKSHVEATRWKTGWKRIRRRS